MKLCVIGTSHIAALKSGWEMVAAEFPGVDLVFFGSPGLTLRGLKVRAPRLVPEDEDLAANIAHTSGGQRVIVPRNHDAVLLFGLNFVVPRLRRGISRAVVEAALANRATRGLCGMTAQKVRRVTHKPMWVVPNPLEVAPKDAHAKATFHDYTMLLQGLARSFPVPEARFLPQPAQTIGPDLRVAERWGQGSERLRRPDEVDRSTHHLEGEVKHMNADYGALWVRTNLPVILG